MPDRAVITQGLSKFFGTVRAVHGLDLAVAGGEIYGLLGPNGAGKSTVLRMLAGLLTPTSGRVFVMEQEVARDPERAKTQLGFLSASTGLYARLSPREVLTFFGRIHAMPAPLLARRLQALADALALGPFLDRRSDTLSTGEQQRVSLARAVLHDPQVLVLDEPTNGLDILASRFLRDFVRAERDRGKAVIFSTHYLAEAELLCDRVGLMHRGTLIREGTPAELRAQAGAATLEQAFLLFVGAADGARATAGGGAAN